MTLSRKRTTSPRERTTHQKRTTPHEPKNQKNQTITKKKKPTEKGCDLTRGVLIKGWGVTGGGLKAEEREVRSMIMLCIVVSRARGVRSGAVGADIMVEDGGCLPACGVDNVSGRYSCK